MNRSRYIFKATIYFIDLLAELLSYGDVNAKAADPNQWLGDKDRLIHEHILLFHHEAISDHT